MPPPEAPVGDRREALIQAARRLGVDLGAVAADALLEFLSLLQKWNRVYNLSAVRDPDAMLVQHVVDSLAAVAPLRRELGARGARVLDVGSGAGLPGLVIAAAAPELEVTCIDAVGKKVAFVREAAAALGLGNLRAEHVRAEDLRVPAFDAIISRAFASLADFVARTRHLADVRTVWMAMKGREPVDEISALPAGFGLFHVEPLTIPGLAAERCLVWMRLAVAGA